MKEVWKDVPGLTGVQASSEGRIRSRRDDGWYVHKATNNGRCLQVRVFQVSRLLHRLVCAAFNGPAPEGKNQTRHLNGNPLDNRPVNLAWGTNSENQQDRFAHGTACEGERNYRSRLTADDVKAIMDLRRGGAGPKNIAETIGVDRHLVKHVIYGQAWNWLTGLPRNRH